MNWVDQHPPRIQEDKTLKPVAFRAFQPNIQLTNNEVHALIARGALDVWAYPGDLLTELRKSYPDCDFDRQQEPSKVIFKGESSKQFYSDFSRYLEKKGSPQIG